MKKKEDRDVVSCEGTVTNDCRGIVGSFGEFNAQLFKKGFAGQRVLITYQKIPAFLRAAEYLEQEKKK